jgi:hypothetical protein
VRGRLEEDEEWRVKPGQEAKEEGSVTRGYGGRERDVPHESLRHVSLHSLIFEQFGV